MRNLLIGLLALGSISAFAQDSVKVTARLHLMAQLTGPTISARVSQSALEYQSIVLSALEAKDINVASWTYIGAFDNALTKQNFVLSNATSDLKISCKDKPLIKIGGCKKDEQCQVMDGARVVNRSVTTIEFNGRTVSAAAKWNKENTSCLKSTLKAIRKL